MKKHETNTEFLDRIMNVGCPTGALIQPFVLEALIHYCWQLSQEELKDEDALPFISHKAWKDTGEWLAKEIEEHLK